MFFFQCLPCNTEPVPINSAAQLSQARINVTKLWLPPLPVPQSSSAEQTVRPAYVQYSVLSRETPNLGEDVGSFEGQTAL
jgi:hypothetical protein